MPVRAATPRDLDGLLALAAEAEHLFGPMVSDPDFLAALHRNIDRQTALVAARGPVLTGGLLFGAKAGRTHLHWLVVSTPFRGTGVGRALVDHVLAATTGPVEVITFGEGHPGAGARTFYQRLGFTPGETVAPGPDGGARQRYRLTR